MTRLFTASHGQIQEFLKKLGAAGLTAEQVVELNKNPGIIKEWVAALPLAMAPTIAIEEAFAGSANSATERLLLRAGFNTLQDVAELSAEELERIPQLGPRRHAEVSLVLQRHHLRLSTHHDYDAGRIKAKGPYEVAEVTEWDSSQRNDGYGPTPHGYYPSLERAYRREEIEELPIYYFVVLHPLIDFRETLDQRKLTVRDARRMSTVELRKWFGRRSGAVAIWLDENMN